ncbi:MAG: DUF58 domain-containing protein [Chitinophagia bacterium]|nr:DUF58 domain-containing protein [Chitinophagia bacterium]
MKFNNAGWRLRYALQLVPFTLNTVLFTAGAWLAWRVLYQPVPKGEEGPQLLPFVLLMGKIALLVFFGLVLVSVLSTFACWLAYLLGPRRKGSYLKLDFTTKARRGKANKLFMTARLEGAWRPFLGFVKGRIIYDNERLSDQFALLSNTRAEGAGKSAISGKSRLVLPDVKEYDLRGGFVYFQDMLHLFSLAVPQPIGGHFYQPPLLLSENADNDTSPKQTETLDVRIEQMRRVEGEYLNYKDFEAGDDVRRIVWKVYAKNRELVVRVPEQFEPFASHLHLYASFYENVKAKWTGSAYLSEMLNYYKSCVWTVYDALAQKEWQVQFIPDQQFNIASTGEEAEKVARTIANCQWQQERTADQYFNVKTGAVLVISSLSDTADITALLGRMEPGTVVCLVKVSRRLRHFAPLNWLARLVLLPPQDRLSRLRTSWTFSPLRVEVLRREKALEALLRQSGVTWADL